MIAVSEDQLNNLGIQPLSEETIGALFLSTGYYPDSSATILEFVSQAIDARPGNTKPSSKLLPELNRSPKKNWVELLGGLPIYIKRIAKHVHQGGKTISHAIAIAINTVKKWCATGDITQFKGLQRLNKISRAQACAAMAQWEKMKAEAKIVLTVEDDMFGDTTVEAKPIMSDAEAFSMFGLQWPEDLPEYWDNPQGSDEYMDKLGSLLDVDDSVQEENDGQEEESADQRQRSGSTDEGTGIERPEEHPGGGSSNPDVEQHRGWGRESTVSEHSESGSGDGITPGSESESESEPATAEVEGSPGYREDQGAVELTVSDKPWSGFKASSYTDAEWKRACIFHAAGSDKNPKSYCKLPVREPDGTLNKNGVHAAASRIGQVQSSPEQVKAAKTLVKLYGQLKEQVPENVKKLAGGSTGGKSKKSEGRPWNMSTPIRAPWELSDPHKITSNLYWKQILPKGTITYEGASYTFDDEALELAVQNYNSGAFDSVPFMYVNEKNEHTASPDLARGVMVDMQTRSDGLYGLFQVHDSTAMLLANNPKFGVSPKVWLDYYRESDGAFYKGPVVEHVVGSFHQRVCGMKPWEAAVELTASDSEVVDLSEQTFVSLELSREESEFGMEEENTQTTTEGGGEEATTEEQTTTTEQNSGTVLQFTQAEFDRAVELAGSKSNEKAQQAMELAQKTQRELRQERIEREIDEYKHAGVPPAMLELARPFLFDDDSEAKLSFLELTTTTEVAENGEKKEKTSVEKREASRGELIRKMLDMNKGVLELTAGGGPVERGTGTTQQDNSDEDKRKQEHDGAYSSYLSQIGG